MQRWSLDSTLTLNVSLAMRSSFFLGLHVPEAGEAIELHDTRATYARTYP